MSSHSDAPLHIFLDDTDLIKFNNNYYNSNSKKQPLRIKQLQYYGSYKIIQLAFTKKGYKKVCAYGVVTKHIILPDQMTIYNAKPQVICEEERIIWYIYKRLKTVSNEEVRKFNIDNILNDLEDI